MKFKDPSKLIAQLQKDVQEATGEAIAKVDLELDRVIESESEFQDLGFVEQDIVDTGRLRDSKVITATPNGVTFSYDPVNPDDGYHYASAIFLGFNVGRKYIPGRPWTNRAVKNENPTVNVAEHLRGLGYKVRTRYDGTEMMEG